MATNNGMQLNIGPMRSSMELTIHTYHASRMWFGRPQSDGRSGIMGLSGFLAITNRIIYGSIQDDPYSDWWMLRLENKLNDIKQRLEAQKEQVKQVFESIPSTFTLSENLNLQPARVSIYANSPLGFLAVYLVADYDEIVRQTMLARHIGLIDHHTHNAWVDHGGHLLRSLFTVALHYRYSGTKRGDFAANNAAARAAIEKFGEVPKDVMEGTLRSKYSPPLARADLMEKYAAENIETAAAAPDNGDVASDEEE